MRIVGTHIPEQKSLSVALRSAFGINEATANKICAMIGVRKEVKLHQLRARHQDLLGKVCREHISTDIERKKKNDVKHLMKIKHYKGVRHMFGLPARGQRTRTNAQTSKRQRVVKPVKSKIKGKYLLSKGKAVSKAKTTPNKAKGKSATKKK